VFEKIKTPNPGRWNSECGYSETAVLISNKYL